MILSENSEYFLVYPSSRSIDPLGLRLFNDDSPDEIYDWLYVIYESYADPLLLALLHQNRGPANRQVLEEHEWILVRLPS
jgi:hypothetical protein